MKKQEYPYGIIATVISAEKSRKAVSSDELSGSGMDGVVRSKDAEAESRRRKVSMMTDALKGLHRSPE
jgi:hypothetical protein